MLNVLQQTNMQENIHPQAFDYFEYKSKSSDLLRYKPIIVNELVKESSPPPQPQPQQAQVLKVVTLCDEKYQYYTCEDSDPLDYQSHDQHPNNQWQDQSTSQLTATTTTPKIMTANHEQQQQQQPLSSSSDYMLSYFGLNQCATQYSSVSNFYSNQEVY